MKASSGPGRRKRSKNYGKICTWFKSRFPKRRRADWKRLFYETQQAPPADFPPRAVDISGTFIRFRSDVASVEAKTAWIDRWIERANQKEAAMGGRLDQERKQRREEHQREQEELAAINARWEKL